MSERIGVLVQVSPGPGVLYQLTGVIARHGGDISSVEISQLRPGEAAVYFEIEMPDDPDDAQILRNPRSPFTAYVPQGTLKKGEMLASTGGNGKTIRCDICHGPGLRGLDPVPAIAGRQASYLARQMYDMQAGTRRGTWAPLMKDVVAKLNEDDMMALAAYVTSLPPQ